MLRKKFREPRSFIAISDLSADSKESNGAFGVPIKVMLSTYKRRKIRYVSPHKMKRDWSDWEPMNPKVRRKKLNHSNQALGACLRPQSEWRSRHTYCGQDGSIKPRGYCMYTSSAKCLWWKAFFTSSWHIGQWSDVAMERMIRMVTGLITGLKVST